MATTPFRTSIIGAPPAPARSFSSSSIRSYLQFRSSSSSPRSDSSSPFPLRWRRTKSRAAAVFNQESVLTEEESSGGGEASGSEMRKEVNPGELYVCNIPRSFDNAQLIELFQPYGTVVSVEVSKNPETGVSKGCGYVTMGSKASAVRAMKSLDGIVK
ncbi:31 kDa ribonucleoprotein, chloroplastic [Linum grandiflorum]